MKKLFYVDAERNHRRSSFIQHACREPEVESPDVRSVNPARSLTQNPNDEQRAAARLRRLHLVEELLTQPVQVLVSGRLGPTFSYADGRTLWEKARNKEDFFVVEGAGHYAIYDTPEYVDQTVARLATFFDKHLAAADHA